MENKSLLLIFEIFSIVFTSVLGTLLHFTYDWSKHNPLVAIFSATNESVWEHLKLLFFPMLIVTFLGSFCIAKSFPNFLFAQAISIFIGIAFIIVFFYTYTGILGKNFAILDIGSFFLATILTAYISYRILISGSLYNSGIGFLILLFLFICFALFTYFPPKIELFRDPVSGMFGISKKTSN